MGPPHADALDSQLFHVRKRGIFGVTATQGFELKTCVNDERSDRIREVHYLR